MVPVFEIHLENWASALHIENRGHWSDASWLVELLEQHNITPSVYRLEKDWGHYSSDFWDTGWKIQSHGVHHYYDEKADRSPYFNQEGLPFPPSGGFFFRVLPLFFLRWAIKRSGVFWLHPHDLDENHPKVRNPLLNLKRQWGVKGAKKKLERLLQEVKFA